MKYYLSKDKTKLAKKKIKELEKRKELWIKEKEKDIKIRKSCAKKHYYNISQRIKKHDQEINKTDKIVEELKSAIKQGYIEI
jgi:hypothetical protein